MNVLGVTLLLALAAGPKTAPPSPYIDVGVCPFECCAYRDWRAERETKLFDRLLHMTSLRFVARKILLPTLLLFTISGTQSGAFQSAHRNPPKREQIIVRIRNGKTGLPVWLASPYVYVGKADTQRMADSRRKTTFWSDAHVDVTGANPRKVTIWVDFVHRDCRFATSDRAMYAADFDVDLILSKGVVTPNLCSSKTQTPEPGVLTMWIIPATLSELWNE